MRALPSQRRTQLSLALAIALPTALLLGGGYARRWTGDDGFINLRVVEQLLAGNGFVYNAGERSEAVTSPGWVLILWALGALGFELTTAAWIVALVASGIGSACAGLAAYLCVRDEQEEPAFVLPLGGLIYAALPAAWDYATSALENGLGLAYLGGGFLLATRALGKPPRYGSLFVLGLAPLVRPDYALFGAPLILLLLARQQSTHPRRLLAAAIAAAPALSYQLFRMGYFAAIVPNTALAKEAFEPRWEQGLHYLANLLGPYWLTAPLIAALGVLAIVLAQKARADGRASIVLPASLATLGLLHALYVVRVGGDFMHGRMLLPSLFSLLAPVSVVSVAKLRAWATGPKLVAVLFVIAWTFPAGAVSVGDNEHGIGDERAWHARNAQRANPLRLADYERFAFYGGAMHVKTRVAEGCPNGLASLERDSRDACRRVALPDPMDGVLEDQPDAPVLPLAPDAAPSEIVATVGFRPLGISGNVLGIRINVTDHFGLADPVASRLELAGRGRPGHEKTFTTVWFAAKYAAQIATRDPAVTAARHALSCGFARELHLATHEPLTWSRFLQNIELALPLHGLRIPLDPFRAERELCAL